MPAIKLQQLYDQSLEQLTRALRWRVWLQEKLQPTDWQITLGWAALVGFLGALSALVFTGLTEGVHQLLTGSSAGIVESMRQLPAWLVVLVPAIGGLATGLVLHFGQRFQGGAVATDYMEAIAIGSGRIPMRASLVKSAAALFAIGSGGSIGREGPMVQLAAVLASAIGRWRDFSPQQQRLLVACGAASGIASAYNAPIGGSFFIAEIILGTIAMETLGPLAVAAITAALTMRVFTDAAQLYAVPTFRLASLWEIGSYLLLGMIVGTFAPWFVRSLRRAERFFRALPLPLIARLVLGGLIVGTIAVWWPEVCGNGYSVVVGILNGHYLPQALVVLFLLKWLATGASFGSGAPGGVFTPSLFMGASIGLLFGSAVHALWPGAASDPRAFALVGMGAFLAAATHAPVMATIMLFEMTLSYDIVLPLLLCAVVAYFTSRGIEGTSLYGESLRAKAAANPADSLDASRVEELMRADPPTVTRTAPFAEIARLFLTLRVNNLYVVDAEGRFVGVVSLHDVKPVISQPELGPTVIANDILRDDFPRVRRDAPLGEALQRFREVLAERLPVVDADGKLVGSLAKTDVVLALTEKHATATPARAS